MPPRHSTDTIHSAVSWLQNHSITVTLDVCTLLPYNCRSCSEIIISIVDKATDRKLRVYNDFTLPCVVFGICSDNLDLFLLLCGFSLDWLSAFPVVYFLDKAFPVCKLPFIGHVSLTKSN